MDRHDRASGSHDRGRAQITQICTRTGGTLTRQSAAPNGGSSASGDQEFLTEGDGVIEWQPDRARRSGPDQADREPARSLAGAADLR